MVSGEAKISGASRGLSQWRPSQLSAQAAAGMHAAAARQPVLLAPRGRGPPTYAPRALHHDHHQADAAAEGGPQHGGGTHHGVHPCSARSEGREWGQGLQGGSQVPSPAGRLAQGRPTSIGGAAADQKALVLARRTLERFCF